VHKDEDAGMKELTIIAAAVGATCLLWWWLNWIDTKKQKVQAEEWERHRLSDDNVIKQQLEFEERLEQNVDLPDGVCGKQAFIYRNLVRTWFRVLIAKHQYDEPVAKNIKLDWLNYMYLLEHQRTTSFLSAETDDKERRETYAKEAWEQKLQYETIEDAFAASMGNHAIKQLQQIRQRKHSAFDRPGRNIAPVGFQYFPASFNPYSEKLIADK
jgi:hypothetical protein